MKQQLFYCFIIFPAYHIHRHIKNFFLTGIFFPAISLQYFWMYTVCLWRYWYFFSLQTHLKWSIHRFFSCSVHHFCNPQNSTSIFDKSPPEKVKWVNEQINQNRKNKCLEEVSAQKQEPETWSTSVDKGETSFVIGIKFQN